jgi:hypothetical protein
MVTTLRVKPMNRRESIVLSAERDADLKVRKTRSLPSELRSFAEPNLLPGESHRDFAIIQKMMIDEVQPVSCMEWLWTLDLVELSWEILRYRRLKMRILALDRSAAIEAIVLRVDGEGLPIEAMPMVRQHARRAAADWRTDPQAAVDIETYLERNGFDQIDINAQVIAQERELFLMFDHLMQSAQSRRVQLLREIHVRRELARRAQK